MTAHSGHDLRTPAAGASARTLPSSLAEALVQRLADAPPTAPSMNVALFDREGVLFHHSIGEHRLDGRAPSLGTVYRIASMSKSVEAAAVLVLRDRGLLDLDDLVSAHVPEFADPVDADGTVVPVTIRMLLTNSSGLPEDNGWADHVMGMSRDEFLAVVARGLSFTERPGGVYQYSNVGFWLLGVIVENLAGQSFADFATTTLLEPLGLRDTRYDASDYGPDADLALGCSTFDEGATWVERPVVASGAGACAASLFSTLPDIARWSAWLSRAFDLDDHSSDAVLSRASRREMQQGATVMPSIADRAAESAIEGTAYGRGLVIEQDVRFGAIAHHSGGLPGWSSNMRWHLASGLGVVVFANADGAKPAPTASALLRTALEELEPPAREITLLPSTVDAALAIDAAIVSGDLAAASALFSPNLLSDVPAEVRARRLDAAFAEVGGPAPAAPLADRLLWSASAAHVAFAVPGRDGDLECRIEMTPTVPALVQRLVVVRREPATPLSPVTRRYRPRLP